MGLFDFFKKKKKYKTAVSNEQITYSVLPDKLTDFVNKSVSIFEQCKETEAIYNKLDELTENKDVSTAIFRFVPIELCRLMFPEVSYPDYYSVYTNEVFTEHKYINNEVYNAVHEVISKTYKNFSEEAIYAILAHSSAFNALNEALHNGSNLADLQMSPCIFID